MSIQILLGCALLLAAATVVVRSRSGATAPATADRLRRGMPEPAATVTVEAPTTSAFEPVLARVGALVRRLAPRRSTELLETRLAAADLQGSWSADQLLALKLVLLVVGFGLGLAFLSMKPGVMGFIFLGVFTLAGWRLPDIVAGSRADERKRAIELQLPDTMDQLTIAVEAGLGFEAAMARVARTGTGPLAAELRRTLQDIQLGVSRGDALTALGERTDVTDVRRFVSATRQAERYGLPIATVLRTQAAELRDKRRQRAEEHAMKIPVKVLFPLVLCILPTLFIVILGPGIIRIVANGGFGG